MSPRVHDTIQRILLSMLVASGWQEGSSREAVRDPGRDRGGPGQEVEVAVGRNGRIQIYFESWKTGLPGSDALNQQDSEALGDLGANDCHREEGGQACRLPQTLRKGVADSPSPSLGRDLCWVPTVCQACAHLCCPVQRPPPPRGCRVCLSECKSHTRLRRLRVLKSV